MLVRLCLFSCVRSEANKRNMHTNASRQGNKMEKLELLLQEMRLALIGVTET